MSTPRGQKRQLEMARLERAARKRQRRHARSSDTEDSAEPAAAEGDTPEVDESEVLAALAELHRKFADDEIGFEEFETEREALSQRLEIP